MKLEIENSLSLNFRCNENIQENSSVAEILVQGYSLIDNLTNYKNTLRIYTR